MRDGLLWIIGAALVAALGGNAWMGFQLQAQKLETQQARQELTEEKLASSQEREARERVSRETIQAHREREAEFNKKLREAEHAKNLERLEGARIAAALRAERDGLRDSIASFARGGEGSDDPLAACRERSAAIGDLLERALRADARHVEAAEAHSSDVRALLSAWPVNP